MRSNHRQQFTARRSDCSEEYNRENANELIDGNTDDDAYSTDISVISSDNSDEDETSEAERGEDDQSC